MTAATRLVSRASEAARARLGPGRFWDWIGAVPAAPALQIEVSRNVTRRCPILVMALSLPRIANPGGSVPTLAFQKLTKKSAAIHKRTAAVVAMLTMFTDAADRPISARSMKPIARKAWHKQFPLRHRRGKYRLQRPPSLRPGNWS